MKGLRRDKNISIISWLVIPSIMVLLVAFTLIGSFFVQTSLKNSNLILNEFQSHMEKHINEELIQRFENAEQLNQINVDMFKAGILDINYQEEREIYFSNIFKSYPEMAMSFIALPDGSFYGARRDPDGEILVVRNNESTKGTSQYFSTDKPGAGVKLEEEFPNFDPRIRPWYLSAIKEGKATYSDVYLHFVFKEPVITASRPVYDENNRLIAVFGADYLLTWLEDFLDKLLIGENGKIFITDDKDRIIASTLDMENYLQNGDKLDLINISETNNKFIKESIGAIENMDSKERQAIIIEGKKYYTGLVRLDKNFLNWKVHFLVMEDDFLGSTKKTLLSVILLLVLSILILMGVFTWLVRKITKPIEGLTVATEEISEGHLNPIVYNGKIDELVRLTNSFNRMGKRVRDTLEDLENKVASRTYELECANSDLERLSFVDGLTGIYNRRKFDDEYSLAWNTARRYGRKIAILMIDIDYFKKYNDTYGHLKGDDCLKTIAKELRKMPGRSTDLVARYGGEEFVILLKEVEEDKIEVFADKIRKGIEELEIEHSTSEFRFVTVSVGIAAMVPKGELDSNQLIENADKALYKAKENGRNKIYLYEDEG